MNRNEYKKEITAIFNQYTRRGFVEYGACGRLCHELCDLLEAASRELTSKELFDVACRAFIKWGKTDKDDSDGDTQVFMDQVLAAWQIVYEYGQMEISHDKMMKWMMKNLDGSVIDYMEEYLYEFMVSHFKEAKLLQKKFDFLQAKIREKKDQVSEHSYAQYEIVGLETYCLQIMSERQEPIEKIRAFSEKINCDSVKEKLAEIEMEYGNFDQAIQIYQSLAEEADAMTWRINQYRVILKDIYRRHGDTEKYFQELKQLVYVQIGDSELYEEYKAQFTSEEWEKEKASLFAKVKLGDLRANRWYAIEERYDLIMDNVEAASDTMNMKTYEKELKKRYPERCLTILANAANQQAKNSSKRSEYKRIAYYLRWMLSYPNGSKMAEELAETYRSEYPRRRAMLDELAGF